MGTRRRGKKRGEERRDRGGGRGGVMGRVWKEEREWKERRGGEQEGVHRSMRTHIWWCPY